VRPHLQRLIVNEKQLEGDNLILSQLGVYDNCIVLLIVLLYDFSESNIKNVIFDLYWGYPSRGGDYLDATCLLYEKDKAVSLLDYKHLLAQGVIHSGDLMDHTTKIGHHKIEADLNAISDKITHIYFTLSAWNCPTIGHFPNPSVKLFDKTKPDDELCQYAIQQAGESQAVIMCSLVRGNKGWSVERIGKFSSGNAKNYKGILQTINRLYK